MSRDHLPIEAELPGLSRFLSKLESFGELPASILLTTKIHKVCKAVLKLENVPGDDIYQFKARFSALRDIYCKTLIQSEQQSGARTGDTPANPQTTLETPSKVEEVLDELPAMCLTQFTPEQCIHFQEVAAACDPPLDRGVVELMCMLPYFTSKYCVCDQQVVPGGRFEQPFHDSLEIDRLVYPGGPTIPPNMLKLTWWLSTNWGIALFVDTKTGEGIQMRDFRPEDKGVVCTEFEGYRRPIEELLQEWIDYYLAMKLVPSGREGILSEEFRSMVSNDNINQYFMLTDYVRTISSINPYWKSTVGRLHFHYCNPTIAHSSNDKKKSTRKSEMLMIRSNVPVKNGMSLLANGTKSIRPILWTTPMYKKSRDSRSLIDQLNALFYTTPRESRSNNILLLLASPWIKNISTC